MNGVVVEGYPSSMPLLWEPCSTGTFRVKEEGSEADLPRFDPIVVYLPFQCSGMGIGDFDKWASRAEAVLDATLAHGIENALAQGVTLSNNPFLGDSALTVLNAGAVSPAVGLRYLENAIGSLSGRQGIIHSTPAVVDAWGAGGGLDPTGDTLVTTAGTPVVSGSGYIGVNPVVGGEPGETVDWVFATGPVQVRSTTASPPSLDDSLDRSDNTVVIRAERYVLVEWDTSLQVGIRIDWSQS